MIKLLFKIFLLAAIVLAVLFFMHKERILKEYKDLKKTACRFIDKKL